MIRVIVESPYAGNVKQHIEYLRACLRDCLMRGEAPFASHAIYTLDGVLRDSVPDERKLGIGAGFAWHASAEKSVVYCDYGISDGMKAGIRHAEKLGLIIEYRKLGEPWS